MYEFPPPSVTRRLLDLLAPSHCLACTRRTGDPGRDLGLCLRCWARLVPAPRCRCSTCGSAIDPQAVVPDPPRCGACRSRPPAIDSLEFVWRYAPPLDAVVSAMKFGRLGFLAPQLGRRVASEIGGTLREALGAPGAPGAPGATDPPLVTWVPLHWRRRALRGFDQAEGLARALGGALRLDVDRALRRSRATAPQSRRGRSGRDRGVRGAFQHRPAVRVRGRSVLLVDDVVTTGSTLDAAARCLRRAGARRVTAAVVARTPSPGEVEAD